MSTVWYIFLFTLSIFTRIWWFSRTILYLFRQFQRFLALFLYVNGLTSVSAISCCIWYIYLLQWILILMIIITLFLRLDLPHYYRKKVIFMFDRFFNDQNPLWTGMSRIFDVFILNILWLLCCMPVFTIGPSTTAFFYAMINLVRGEENSVPRDFFRSFRQNFKQAILLGIPLTAIGAFLAVDVAMSHRAGTGIYTFFMVFFSK